MTDLPREEIIEQVTENVMKALAYGGSRRQRQAELDGPGYEDEELMDVEINVKGKVADMPPSALEHQVERALGRTDLSEVTRVRVRIR